jgi:phenylalanyl-tRNA synthetase beta chain
MNVLTKWLRSYLPELPVDDAQLAEDLTLRGIAVEGVHHAACSGSLFEMDITTNRVDAMNHYGIAREAAAMYGLTLAPITESLAAAVPENSPGSAFPVRIAADAEALCGRFTARVIRGVDVKPATGLMAEYFSALGQKPISAPVDATNFAWLAMGQPTHVFDLDKIVGGITVRRAGAGETLRLLDGTERTLTTDDLIIADDVKALGLAGVMGGWDSRVTEETKNILVEGAWFSPVAIRASSRRHGLHTDASHRYERGADFNAAPLGNHLVTHLILDQCGGEVVGPLADIVVASAQARTAARAPIALRASEITRHLGATLDGQGIASATIETYLRALGCDLAPTATGTYTVTLPSWRLDLEREIDLVEEVARVYGYNRFANTLPAFAGEVVEHPHIIREQGLRNTLRALGYSEAVSSTFTSAEEAAVFGPAQSGAVAMGNPLSDEAGMLRPSLLPNMASMLAENLRRGVATVRLFEMGTIFTGSAAAVDEAPGLVLGATGALPATGNFKAEDALFYELKGALETLLAKFIGTLTFDAASLPAWIDPGRGARALLDRKPLAVFGELSAAEAAKRKMRQLCVLAELDGAALLRAPLRSPNAKDASRFQPVERDFSFIFPDAIVWGQIEQAVHALGIPELLRLSPIEIFRDPKGKAVSAGSYSLLLRFILQSQERTLGEDEIASASERIVAALVALGGLHRDS